jgi:hypothetical protein
MDVGATTQAPALGRGTRSVQVVGSNTYWIADDRSGLEHSMIVSWEQPAAPRAVVLPSRDGGRFQLLTVGPEWMAWIEHVDTRTPGDTRVYAARRGSPEKTLVDDMTRYGEITTYPELALDGSDLYWTIPQRVGGQWKGLLKHQDLAVGTAETLDTADRALFSWPTAGHGVIAYEVAREGSQGYTVRYRRGDRTSEIPGPVSEPSVGDGYLLVKIADRYAQGAVGVAQIDGSRVTELGKGEAPHADGALAVWQNAGALGGIVARPKDHCVAPFLSPRMVNDSSEFGLAIGGMRLAWVYMMGTANSVTEFVRTATIERFSC